MTSSKSFERNGVASRRESRAWERRYWRKLLATDLAVIIVSVFGAQFIRFGPATAELEVPVTRYGEFILTYTVVSTALVLLWLLALSVGDTRDSKVFGTGPSEYKRVAQATIFTFGIYAIIAYLARAQIGRGYLLLALPIGLFLLLLTRWLWRKRLHRQRAKARNRYRTLIVGERTKSTHVAREIMRDGSAGFNLVGAVTDRGSANELLPNVPVFASFPELVSVVDEQGVDTVIITSTDAISPEHLRRIGWELEARQVDLIVTAALTDVAGPRIHMRPVSGLPLIHIDYPKFVGRKQFAKRMSDIFGSVLLLVLLSPLLLVLAILVAVTSSGPVLFKQERVGQGGRTFRMLKFRSMIVNAEDLLPGLLDQSDGNGQLFKMKNDPRITRVGSVLRKYSLDELPQLVNVLKGEMSLVGPRPPLPHEVESYEEWVHRRLLVKPGITGLWQVSGRSNLSWEDSVRLDLYYVENWSLMGDLIILWRTVKTVAKPEGAY